MFSQKVYLFAMFYTEKNMIKSSKLHIFFAQPKE